MKWLDIAEVARRSAFPPRPCGSMTGLIQAVGRRGTRRLFDPGCSSACP